VLQAAHGYFICRASFMSAPAFIIATNLRFSE